MEGMARRKHQRHAETSIKVRLEKLTTLRKHVRARVLAQRRMLLPGLGLASGHQNPHELAHGSHSSGPQSWGCNARSTVEVTQPTPCTSTCASSPSTPCPGASPPVASHPGHSQRTAAHAGPTSAYGSASRGGGACHGAVGGASAGTSRARGAPCPVGGARARAFSVPASASRGAAAHSGAVGGARAVSGATARAARPQLVRHARCVRPIVRRA